MSTPEHDSPMARDEHHSGEANQGARLAESLIETSEQSERADAVERMVERGWAKEAPDFAEQIADESRNNTFRYIPTNQSTTGYNAGPNEHVVTMTEHEGLVALDGFLAARATESLVGVGGEDLSTCAADLRAGITFIGQPELQEAFTGIKDYWLSYLDGDPVRQIYVVSTVSTATGRRKSDQFIHEQVMAQLTAEERERYAGRIVNQASELTTAPENAKIILIDDWIMSGRQMATSAYRAMDHLADDGGVPTNTAAITGTHASGDYGVEFVIAELVKAKAKRGEPIPMPPLTNIIREYRGEEQLEWTTEEYHGDRPDIDDYLEDEL
jgi:hypothetical protein